LDSVLHALALESLAGQQGDGPLVPFSFSGVRLYGRGGASLRACLVRAADGTASLLALDSTNAPVLSIEGLRTRTIDRRALRVARRRGEDLYELAWVELGAASSNGWLPRAAVLGEAIDAAGIKFESHPDLGALNQAIEAGGPAPELVLVNAAALAEPELSAGELASAVRVLTARALELCQIFLASEPLMQSRLVLLTERAVATGGGDCPDLAQAALVGLLRSAHTEHPDRFALIDTDGSAASLAALRSALWSDEPELALREGSLYAPRLTRVQGDRGAAIELDPGGTVLITGATGGLGALVARHLVSEHGVRRLLLLSRGGPEAAGAVELRAALEEQGCAVRVEACDVADRARLAEVIATIPPEHALTTVIHAAGVLEDGVIGSLDSGRLARVMAPKVDAAINLHELTARLELSEFILYSSAAGVLGTAGQANYAAANAFLDALAHHRRAQGLPALSLAWGAWEGATGMTGALGEADRARLGRLGIVPLSDARGLQLLDIARAIDQPVLLPVRLSSSALRAQAIAGMLPALMRSLVRSSVGRTRDPGDSLAKRLAAAPAAERDRMVIKLVTQQVGDVLGHAPTTTIEPNRSFLELGLDSLASVELRNRLSVSTGLHLPPLLAIDHPTAAAVAGYILSAIDSASTEVGLSDRSESDIRHALSSISPARLRESGLLEPLLRLADPDGTRAPAAVEEPLEQSSAPAADAVDTLLQALGLTAEHLS
ncbi:MAG TPA: type I polyketide synthase, partial [Solirubrobacteraceae bacterium]|nr:type I polyketide synthase [Solirubrobacteraceae bacterium]